MKMKRILSMFLILLIISSSGCLSGEVDDFYGEDISPPIPVDDFVLVDENGETVSMSDFEGKVVVWWPSYLRDVRISAQWSVPIWRSSSRSWETCMALLFRY